jgi:hypothetical protein
MNGGGERCSECGDVYWYSTTSEGRWIEDDDTWMCHSCINHYGIRECEGCEEMRHDVLRYEDSYGDWRYYCTPCAEDNDFDPDNGEEVEPNRHASPRGSAPSVYQVHNYTYRPAFDFKMTSREARMTRHRGRLLFMGTELEMQVVSTSDGGRENNHVLARQYLKERDVHGLVYLKEDASIGYGFELVTHPFTWAWSQENMEPFDMIFGLGKWCEAYRNGRCGMHVHLGRSGFTDFHMYKFARFFYDNPDFIYRVSRRTRREQFVEYANPRPRANLMALARNRAHDGGRGMLNFENGETVECRIFNGTISRGGFFGNLEFLKALYDYTRQAPLHHLVPDGFMEFVESDHYKYFKTLGGAGLWPSPVEE